jgi:putative FmdB family regulatory protein
MPIYAYRCATCGHAQDVLQKMSDPLLTVCPSCGAATYEKQVPAAGFQLKGSGWYVTDFRDGNKGGGKKEEAAPAEGAKPAATDAASAPASADAAKAPAASPAPAAAPAAPASPAAPAASS